MVTNNLTNDQLGRLGETAVALELMKRGYDVINLNESLKNYQHADLLCISNETGKMQKIQVKTGSTKNIYCGLTATPDGVITDLDEKVVCPWVFVHVTPNGSNYNIEFYILTCDETKELLISAHDWYANKTKTGRVLKSNIQVGMDVPWLKAEGSDETYLHYAYKSTLKESAKDRWEKIWE